MLTNILIFTDASFSKEKSLAVLGYGYLEAKEDSLEAKDLILTPAKVENNIRAEIKSALLALENCPKNRSITLYTDCATICGLPGRRLKLESNKYISKAKGLEINNADLYRQFYQLIDLLNPEIIWVKGHMAKNKQSRVNKNFSVLDKAVRFQLRILVNNNETT